MQTLIKRLLEDDSKSFDAMLDLFAEAFDDPQSYSRARPSADYRKELLSREDIVVLLALTGTQVVGALVAYELRKFEQERSEFYIYDLAVGEPCRRQGIAKALIDELKSIASAKGVVTIFVQADYGDDPAVALYTKLGSREDVMHFDISIS